MKEVTLENLVKGMRLSKDVHDRNGRLILPAGTELLESQLRTFKVWRVASVFVEEQTAEATIPGIDSVNPAVKKRVEVRLAQVFRNVDKAHPFMLQLYNYCFNRAVRAKGKSGA